MIDQGRRVQRLICSPNGNVSSLFALNHYVSEVKVRRLRTTTTRCEGGQWRNWRIKSIPQVKMRCVFGSHHEKRHHQHRRQWHHRVTCALCGFTMCTQQINVSENMPMYGVGVAGQQAFNMFAMGFSLLCCASVSLRSFVSTSFWGIAYGSIPLHLNRNSIIPKFTHSVCAEAAADANISDGTADCSLPLSHRHTHTSQPNTTFFVRLIIIEYDVSAAKNFQRLLLADDLVKKLCVVCITCSASTHPLNYKLSKMNFIGLNCLRSR